MAQPPSRSILATIFRNFVNSLRPRQLQGTLVGRDYFGNRYITINYLDFLIVLFNSDRYYEIPPNPSLGKRRSNRWFVPVEKENFQQDMPAEWEAWLRGRRNEPPTEEEVMKNLALMQMKKENAVAVEAKAGKKTPLQKGMETFPQRDGLELIPGKEEK